MAEMKKVTLDSQTQEMLWNVLHDQDEVIADVFGTEVKLTVLNNKADYTEIDDIISEIESDPELQQMLLESDEDIKAGRVYSTDEALRFIKEFRSK
ncbi:hypothetical protein B1A99_12065 [Cohnella sp. CIP 111063]|uniref:hypothetical protein n=1 Tax=unclassified Cohnella TaxID=2636738 RepID=UPI000B8C260A|nr:MULTISPECIES: hypothetical protein [unclassified Cohnella]OXS59345.1 hypothetical protein B1A99_12065 [Cohnella sp. CIP 111063]PRX72375.1 hypothetical protein B0G52_106243 [Cohnella sp. SGD-V74]